jgi:hypothetical protein
LPLTTFPANAASVLQECVARFEYLLLVLHTLQAM